MSQEKTDKRKSDKKAEKGDAVDKKPENDKTEKAEKDKGEKPEKETQKPTDDKAEKKSETPQKPEKATPKKQANQIFNQSVVIEKTAAPNGETRRHHDFDKDKPILSFNKERPNIRTLYDSFQHACSLFPRSPCLGHRPVVNGKAGPFEFITYKDAMDSVFNLAAGLNKLGLKEQAKIGLYSKNRTEWVLMEHASYVRNMVTVALYDSFGPEALGYVVEHAELPVVCGSLDCIQNLIKVMQKSDKITHVIVWETMTEEAKTKLKESIKGWKRFKEVYTFQDLVALGAENFEALEPIPPKASDLAIIMYTSGTTGMPKGVMLTHANVIATVAGAQHQTGNPGLRNSDVYLSYLPLAHILERVVVTALLGVGAKVGFYQGDPRLLTEDIGEIKPTVLAGVPRVFDKIHDGIQAKIAAKGGFSKSMFDKAVKAKTSQLQKGGDTPMYNKLVFEKAQKKLGGRVRMILSGGAPLSADTHRFLGIVFGVPVLQGYGLTETCAGCSITDLKETNFGEVGPPLPCCEVKLVSVAEMDYLVTQDPPRGEICIRGPNVSQGYYKDPTKTKEDWDAEGWFHTGDIGIWTERGTLKIIDRKKNIFKLAQGEYVPAESLELIYNKQQFTMQFWVYGNSSEVSLVAVGSLNLPYCRDWAKNNGVKEDDAESLCKNPQLVAAVLAEVNALGKEEKRQGYEQIRAIHLHPEEFTVDNDLATPTMKLKRPQLLKAFDKEIAAMYKEVNAAMAAREGGAPPKDKKDKKADKAKDKDAKDEKPKDDKPKDAPKDTKKPKEAKDEKPKDDKSSSEEKPKDKASKKKGEEKPVQAEPKKDDSSSSKEEKEPKKSKRDKPSTSKSDGPTKDEVAKKPSGDHKSSSSEEEAKKPASKHKASDGKKDKKKSG